MRGAGDELSVGERIAFYRRRRGLTQANLGALVGRSEEWVSSVERGRRQIRFLDLLTDVARALRVSLTDITGQPVLMEDDHQQDDIPAVRDALMSPGRLSRLLYRPDESDNNPPDPAVVGRYTEQVWFEYQAGRIGRVVAALPSLIADAQRLEDEAGTNRTGWAVSSRIHHLAATTLSKVGESDLSWIAAERALRAAEHADDPLVLASAARAGAHAFLANGRYDDALSLGSTAAGWLAPQMDENDPQALSLFGMLHLRTAVAAARQQDRGTVTELLDRAADAAERLGQDANYWQTGFGPTNVELHRLSAALDLGDVAYVIDRAPQVHTDGMPVERRASRLMDAGRALSLAGHDDEALSYFLDAEQLAPQLVRHSAAIREAVKIMIRRAPASAKAQSSPLASLAQRCRAIA